LANSPQAKKRARQSEDRRQLNAGQRSEMRTYLKNTQKALTAKNPELALEEFKRATAAVDRLAHKGKIHKNKAARHKSRLIKKIKALSVQAS